MPRPGVLRPRFRCHRRDVRQFDDKRAIGDLVLDRFGDATDQMRIVAQQPVMSLVGTAGVHGHQSRARLTDQPRSGHMIGDVIVGGHAFDARTLEAGHQQLPMARRRDGSAHVRLPDVGVARGHAEGVGDGDRRLVTGVGEHTLVKFGAARSQEAVGGPGMHGEYVRERVAAPSPRPYGFVDGQVETHAECGGGEPFVEQRSGGDAERQVHRETEERFARRRCRLIAHPRRIRQRLRESTERALRIIVLIGAVDVVERLKRLAHGSILTYTTPAMWLDADSWPDTYAWQDAPRPSGLDSPCLTRIWHCPHAVLWLHLVLEMRLHREHHGGFA